MYLSTVDRYILARKCSEIMHVQPQPCDHTLNHATIDTFLAYYA